MLYDKKCLIVNCIILSLFFSNNDFMCNISNNEQTHIVEAKNETAKVTNKIIEESVINEKENIEESANIETEEELEIEEISYNYYCVIDDNNEFNLDKSYQDYIYSKCCEYDIEENYELMIALMYHESKFVVDAISQTNDYGLCQINKGNHDWLKKELNIDNFLDPYQNIDAGIYMIHNCLNVQNNDIESALTLYNTGKRNICSNSYSNCIINDLNKLCIIQ